MFWLWADDQKKISHLIELQKQGELNIFEADLTDGDKFDAPIAGCELVFLVATPVNFASEDPEVFCFLENPRIAKHGLLVNWSMNFF